MLPSLRCVCEMGLCDFCAVCSPFRQSGTDSYRTWVDACSLGAVDRGGGSMLVLIGVSLALPKLAFINFLPRVHQFGLPRYRWDLKDQSVVARPANRMASIAKHQTRAGCVWCTHPFSKLQMRSQTPDTLVVSRAQSDVNLLVHIVDCVQERVSWHQWYNRLLRCQR